MQFEVKLKGGGGEGGAKTAQSIPGPFSSIVHSVMFNIKLSIPGDKLFVSTCIMLK